MSIPQEASRASSCNSLLYGKMLTIAVFRPLATFTGETRATHSSIELNSNTQAEDCQAWLEAAVPYMFLKLLLVSAQKSCGAGFYCSTSRLLNQYFIVGVYRSRRRTCSTLKVSFKTLDSFHLTMFLRSRLLSELLCCVAFDIDVTGCGNSTNFHSLGTNTIELNTKSSRTL